MSNDTPTDEYPLHPLFYTNHSIGDEVGRFEQQTFNGKLQVDPGLTTLPPLVFDHIFQISLAQMKQSSTQSNSQLKVEENHETTILLRQSRSS